MFFIHTIPFYLGVAGFPINIDLIQINFDLNGHPFLIKRQLERKIVDLEHQLTESQTGGW